MDITWMLLRKKISLLRNAFTDLHRDIFRHAYDEAKSLQTMVQVKSEETDILFYLMEHMEVIEGNFEMTDLEDNLNRLKRAYHSASRQWRSIFVKHSRREHDIAA